MKGNWLSGQNRVVLGAVLIFLLYLPSLFYPFIYLDDPWLVYENPYLQQVSWENVQAILSWQTPRQDLGREYLPVRDLSYLLDRTIWGFSPFGFHLTNLALHLLVYFASFRLFSRLVPSSHACFWGALLVGIHPLQVEAVVWVSARKDLLYVLFLLVCLLSYLHKNKFSLLLAVFFLLLACLSKAPASIGALLVVLLHLLFPHQVAHRSKVVPGSLLVFSVLITLFHMQVYDHPAQASTWDSPADVIFAIGFTFFHYLKFFVFPVNQALEYPLPAFYLTFYPPLVAVLCSLIPCGVLYWWWRWRRNFPGYWGIPWFFIALLPAIYLILFRSISPLADRYSYLAIVGLSFTAAYVLLQVPKKHRKFLIPAIFLCFYSISLIRVNTWQSHQVLAEDNILRYPQLNSSILRRAFQALENGDRATAWQLAGQVESEGKVWLQQARLFYKMGKPQDSLALLEYWIPRCQTRWKKERAHLLRAKVLLQVGKLQEANHEARRLIDSPSPSNQGKAWVVLGDIAVSQKNYPKAVVFYQRALELLPDEAYILSKIGDTHLLQQNFPQAQALYHKALALSPNYLPAKINLGWIYYYQGDYQKAIEIAQQVKQKGKQKYALLLLKKSQAQLQQNRNDN